MKKSEAFKGAPRYCQEQQDKYERGSLYILTNHFHSNHKQLVLLTHFYRTGLRFKPLSKKPRLNYNNNFFHGISPFELPSRPFTITWRRLSNYIITKVTEEQIPLYINESTPYYKEYLEGRNDHDKLVHDAIVEKINKTISSTPKRLKKLMAKLRVI